MKKAWKQILILFSLIIVLILPYFVFAADPLTNLKNVAGPEGKGPYGTADETSLSQYIGTIISIFLGLLGVIFIVLILYSGYHWMTARGEEAKVEKAQDTLRRAIIGLIIIVGAYAIWAFIYNKLFF